MKVFPCTAAMMGISIGMVQYLLSYCTSKFEFEFVTVALFVIAILRNDECFTS